MKKNTRKSDLKGYSLEEVFGDAWKNRKSSAVYQAEMSRIAIAQSVKRARAAKRMTQAALAKRVDMPQSVIARLESGTHGVSVETLSKVAGAIGKQIKLV
jgi:XRE family transcriptional regulator, regulator of sulfur utilization